jgi:mRNA interferase MazF
MKVFMTTIRPGEIWVADIPFTDGRSSKTRPILVLWVDGSDVVAATVTSAAPRSTTDVLLKDWKISGLKVVSTVRLSRLDCLEQSLLIAKLGVITPADSSTVKRTWEREVKLDF